MFKVLIQECFTINCTLQVFGPIYGHFQPSFNFRLELNIVDIFQMYPQPFSLLRCENTEVTLLTTPQVVVCFGVGSQQQMLPVNVVLYCVSSYGLVVTQMAVIKQSAIFLQESQNTSFLQQQQKCQMIQVRYL